MSAVMVGRDAELCVVGSFLDTLAAGPAALVLAGEPGIGKTTLWLDGVEQARERGYRVLISRPAAAEAQLSYASLADLLAELPGGVLDSLPPPQRRAIDVVLLRSDAQRVRAERRATGAALLSVIERLAADTPVLLGIDDLQWTDTSSARAIDFAVRRLTASVGVLATLRDGGPGWVGRSSGQPSELGRAQRVEVEPLGLAALHGVIRARLGKSLPRPAMVRIQQVSGGNPFYALELARMMGHGDGLPLSTDLTELVRARVAGIPPEVHPVLLVAAALADPTVEAIRVAVRADPWEVVHLLEQAERVGLVALDGHRVHFAHPLLASGIYSAAPSADRRAMHRLLATTVFDLEERARHLALGAVQAEPQTVAALDDAAVRARDRGAPESAAELLDLAIRLGADAPERRIRSAQHHFDAGDPARARVVLAEVVAELAPGRTRAAALRLLATVRLHGDSYREAAGHLRQALGEAGDDLWLRVRILVDLLFVLVNLGQIRDALQLTGETVADAEKLDDPDLLGKALAATVMIRFLSGHGLDAPVLQRSLDLEDPNVPTPVMLRPTLISGLLHAWTGQLDLARERLMALRRRCLERGEESDLMFNAFHTVIVECWRGDLAAAQLVAEDTLERAQQLGTDVPRAIALSTTATVAAYLGRAEEARQAATEALAIFARGSCLAVTVWPMVTLGLLEVSLENYDAAMLTLGPLVSAAPAMGYGEPTAAPYAADAAEALIGVGRLDEAAALIDHLEQSGRRLDRAWALALGARCRSLLLAAQRDLDAAAHTAQRALIEHRRLPMPFERARTMLVLGRIQRRRRQKRAAVEALQEAARTFEEIGTRQWVNRARAELERVVVRRESGAVLTPSEQRVAELAAGGMTNREVAATLFISPKTVEANLARIYRKLAIRSRAELGQQIARARSAEAAE